MSLGLFDAPRRAPSTGLGALPATKPAQGRAWQGREPRRWQREAFAVYRAGVESREIHGGVFFAATGTGKALLLCEIVVDLVQRSTGTIIVTVPTVDLVDQFFDDLARRLNGERRGDRPVTCGRYYTYAKDWRRDVVVTCLPSFASLLSDLSDHARDVSAWVADECHRTDSPTALEAHAAMTAQWGDVLRVGCSATPYLSERDRGLRLWDRILYQYDAVQAIADGVLVPWEIQPLPEPACAIIRCAIRDGDRDGAAALIREQCIAWVLTQRGQGVISAPSKTDAHLLATEFRDKGINAWDVHSSQSRAIIDKRKALFKAGKIDVLVHVRMLVEGVDFPMIRWGALAVWRSRLAFVQELGRYVRSHAGKHKVDLLDPWDLFGVHGIKHVAALSDVIADEEAEAEEEREIARKLATGEWVEILDPLTGKTYRLPADPRLCTTQQAIVFAHADASSYLNEVANVLRNAGVSSAAKFHSGRWRTRPATDAQIASMVKADGAMRAATRAGTHGRAVAACYRLLMKAHNERNADAASPVCAGAVSDFLDVLNAIRVTGKLPDGSWDLSRQQAAFAALDSWGVDSQAMIDSATGGKAPVAA